MKPQDIKCDHVIRAGRVVCPANEVDGPGEVAIFGDKFGIRGEAMGAVAQEFSFSRGVLLPGLIDLHAHPAKSGSKFGIDPDRWMLPTGVTTVASQGDAGADNIGKYVEETIQGSRTRVRLAINLSRIGESTKSGCFSDLANVDIDACVGAIEEHRDFIWAISMNVSHFACEETDPRTVMPRGLEAATQAGVPLLFGMRRPEDWPLAEQLALLRPGDVVTYCYRSQPHCIVRDGRVLPEVREARERGVLFDVGNGFTAFNIEVAEAAIRDGFPPDTISTDLYSAHVKDNREHNLPLVMSMLHAAGMPEKDIFAAVTSRPAKILGLQDTIGSLDNGCSADLTVLDRKEDVTLVDCFGHERRSHRWFAAATFRAGTIVAVDS